jgi:pimeloyl-ACP methyl ester carboxylesterase
MILLHTGLGLLCALGVLGMIMQLGMFANLFVIQQNPESFTLEELLTEPAGIEAWIPVADGGRVRSLHRGSGPTVLLLPDLGLDLVSMNQLWERLAQYGYRVITFDWRGHGASEVGQAGLSLCGLMQDMDAIWRHHRLRRPLVIGHATGAFMGFHYLLQRPELADQVRGLVSVGGYVGGSLRGFRVGSLRDRIMDSRWTERLLRKRLFGWGYVASAFGDQVSPALVRAYLELMLRQPMSRLRLLHHELRGTDLQHSLDRLDLPVLMLASPDDRRIPPPHAQRVAESLPQGNIEWIYRGAGNMLIWEQPAAVVEAVRSFDRNWAVEARNS